MSEAIEMVTYKRRTGFAVRKFLRSSAAMDAWMGAQLGFRSRRIAVADGETIMDIVLWRSLRMRIPRPRE